MKSGGGGRGPWMVLGLVSALAGGAIVFVHYDQKKTRTDMRKMILEEKEKERAAAVAASSGARAAAGAAAQGPKR